MPRVTQDRWSAEFAPHLDAAWRLARWLTGHAAEAEEVVQEACIRAWRAEERVQPHNARAWLLAIVRNTAWSHLRAGRRHADNVVSFEEVRRELALAPTAEAALAEDQRAALLRAAVAALPPIFREVVVLRDLEELSYAETAAVLGLPIGTVMSRLARGRQRLRELLAPHDLEARDGARG